MLELPHHTAEVVLVAKILFPLLRGDINEDK